jgi:hypothetical protein
MCCRVAEDRQDCYWLYVVTGTKTQPTLQEPIKNPARFPWHEVRKVEHYYLSVDALTQPMSLRESPTPIWPGIIRARSRVTVANRGRERIQSHRD